MNVKRILSILLCLWLVFGALVGCGLFEDEQEYVEGVDDPEYVQVVERDGGTAADDEEDGTTVDEDDGGTAVDEDDAPAETPLDDNSEKPVLGDRYTHPSGAFSIAEWIPLDKEVENGALFLGDETLAAILFGAASIEVSEETAPWIAMPLLDSIPEFEAYELAPQVEPANGGYRVSFTATPLPESDFSAPEGDVFITQDGNTLYLSLLLSEDYASVSDVWLAALESLATTDVAAAEDLPAQETPADTPPEKDDDHTEFDLAAIEQQIHSGFDPAVHGFSFFNYGDEINPTDLTPAEMQRMFGDVVCASLADGGCVLTPSAQQWMEQNNSYMAGGHCYGMAALSALMYYGQISPAEFGGSIAYQLPLENEALQREIAYWWATQGTYPGVSVYINNSPTAVVQALADTFEEGKDAAEYWVIGFYKRDFTDGHAVTPLSVENLGDGRYNIMVYDNNFPDEIRAIQVDTNTDTWQYEGSPNPEIESDLYEGDADSQTLEIVDLTQALQRQECHFCSEGFDGQAARPHTLGSTGSKVTPQHPDLWQALQARWDLLIHGVTNEFYQIWLVGDFDLLVVDNWNRRIGVADGGQYINEIPGASRQHMMSAGEDNPPVYRIPVGLSFEVVIDASNLADVGQAAVSLIGPGYYLDVTDIWLEPGQVDTIGVHIDKSRHQLTYFTEYDQSPILEMGVETDQAAYALRVMATELIGAEDCFDVGVDTDTGEFILNTSYNTDPSTYEVYVLRIDDDGEHVFGASAMVLDPENTVYIAFTDWEGPGSGLPVQIDYENDGEIDDEFEFADVSDEVEFYAPDAEPPADETPPAVAEPSDEEEPDWEVDVPAGQGVFVFYNESEFDLIIEVASFELEVLAGEVGTLVLDPGDYTWQATMADNDSGTDPEPFTIEADGVYETGVE